MGLYSAKEMRSKMSTSKREMREFEPKENKLYHLWIPKDSFYYIKKHFNIHSVPAAKNCKIKAVTCINSDSDMEKRRCPICEHIEGLWEQWRAEKGKAEKKAIQNTINRFSAEYIYVNALDVNDADLKFVALRLTKGMMESLSIAVEDTPIENIIWQYKKANKNEKIEYTFLESPNDPRAIELCKEYDTLAERTFADGGPVDLIAALSYDTTEKKYLELLAGAEHDDDDSGDDDKPVSKKVESKPKATATKKKVDVEIEDDDSISLDDVEMEDTKKKVETKVETKKKVETADDDLELDDDFGLDEVPEKKAETKKAEVKVETKKPVESKEDDIDLDDIDLDDLELDDLDLDNEVDEMVDVDAAAVNEHKANKPFIGEVVNVMVKAKYIKRTGDYATDLKAAYAYLKTNKTKVQISKSAVEIPF